ncbi:GNAT family N-acetyltransferase [Mariniplasma anaerobium]|uniref:N-acetyltransferase domain-containing protein n=1 Tax=Mariniplasma anaerobium TaxID=2735436 RepID=A0A7U9XUK5_9MOLU|nr:GNAT family N-acetyltransferase [Mariniplasma anaerobium]BCR35900.1 hypothetical protein MPAN_007930 [Mariniplasma anaerobium]
MSITLLQEKDINFALTFLNKNINQYDLLYKPFDLETFVSSFFSISSLYHTITLIYKDKDQIIGLASASYIPKQNKAYITFLMVDINHQKKGIGSSLLHKLETILSATNQNISSLDIVFFNPVHLKWHMPFNDLIEHPNAPGIDRDSYASKFFTKYGYEEFAIQNIYYRNLKDYTQSEYTLRKLNNLLVKEIEITFYDAHKHYGFDQLFDSLHSKTWEFEIKSAIEKQKLPVLVAVKNDLIIGFAGPLYVESNMRGYFAGIGIHAEYRNLGIGSLLFSKLCLNLKLLGAHYMTLFTGDNNPARKIYEQEGFVIQKTWSNLRKYIK